MSVRSSTILGAGRVGCLGLALAVTGLFTPVEGQDPDSTVLVIAPDSIGVDSISADSIALQGNAVVVDPLPEEVLLHLGHLLAAFPDTPTGLGLISTGMAEATLALEYVHMAGQDTLDLENMRGTMANVIHAIEPSEVRDFSAALGPAYGFKRAAEATAVHIEMAMSVPGVNDNFLFHAPYVLGAANGALSRADDAIAMARRVQAADDPVVALRLLERLGGLVRAMAYGYDADDDGRIGQNDGEFGLAQATYHLNTALRYQGVELAVATPDTIGAGR